MDGIDAEGSMWRRIERDRLHMKENDKEIERDRNAY
jgi:hypothetical protein